MKIITLFIILTLSLFADDDFWSRSTNPGVKPVTNQTYIKECSACHFAYQPGLLPSKSWDKIMANLENHFNTDASLAPEDFQIISDYLNKNSAEKAMEYKRSRRIIDSLRIGEIPESISKTPYILRKHHELRPAMIKQPEVKGIFNCVACHTTADKGIYSERDINVPNYGRWED